MRRFRRFQLLVSLFERLSPSLVTIVCETFVILIGYRILLAVHAGLREIVIRQIPLFLFTSFSSLPFPAVQTLANTRLTLNRVAAFR